jgi:hypothetical protein
VAALNHLRAEAPFALNRLRSSGLSTLNLKASVRSRDARHRTAGIGRDLIEAGLN